MRRGASDCRDAEDRGDGDQLPDQQLAVRRAGQPLPRADLAEALDGAGADDRHHSEQGDGREPLDPVALGVAEADHQHRQPTEPHRHRRHVQHRQQHAEVVPPAGRAVTAVCRGDADDCETDGEHDPPPCRTAVRVGRQKDRRTQTDADRADDPGDSDRGVEHCPPRRTVGDDVE